MRFFVDFLNHFNTTELLHMFADGAFRTSDEIKLVDSAINHKVMFQGESISSEYMRVYEYLQRIMDAIGALYKVRLENLEQIYRHGTEVPVNFQYFIKYGENEREVPRLNIIERRIIFAFKARDENVDYLTWAKLALAEFLNYVLREFEDADRIGLIIKNEEHPHIQAKFTIKVKCDFVNTPIMEKLRSVSNIGNPLVDSGSMTMRALRIRVPVLYRLLTAADLPEECDWLSPISP